MSNLKGKVAWITGGGSGIGLAGAVRLAKLGVRTVLTGRDQLRLRDACDVVRRAGGEADALALDVCDAAAVAKAAASIIDDNGRVDILINSAGLNVKNRDWESITSDAWDSVIGANLDGTFYCVREVLPAMRKQQDGLIINISSWAGRYVSPMTGPAYSTAKHGVVAMTHSLNMHEGRNGIRSCVICPGEVDTPIVMTRPTPPTAEQREKMLQADDVAEIIGVVAQLPARACINEVVMSPTQNRTFQWNNR